MGPYAGSYGTGEPQIGQSQRAAEYAFERVDKLRRAEMAKEEARKAGLNDYNPDVDKVWDRDMEEIRKDIDGYREKSADYYQSGADINDPGSGEAYTWNKGTQSMIDGKIAMTEQHKAMWGEAAKLLSTPTAADAYEPESWVRLDEYYDAPDIEGRQKVMEKYGGVLVVPRQFDLGKYAQSIIPKASASVAIGPSGTPNVRKETTTTEVTDQQLLDSVRSQSSLASAGDWKAARFMQSVDDYASKLTPDTRAAFQKNADEQEMSEAEYYGVKILRGYAPGAEEKVTTKNNPVPRSSGGSGGVAGQKRQAELLTAERFVKTLAGIYNGDGAEWIEIGGNVGATATEATGVPGVFAPTAVRQYPLGIKFGTYTAETATYSGTQANPIKNVTGQSTEDNMIQSFYNIGGKLYYQTSESLAKNQGVTRAGIPGLLVVSDGTMDRIMDGVIAANPELKLEVVNQYLQSSGGRYDDDPNNPLVNFGNYKRGNPWVEDDDDGTKAVKPGSTGKTSEYL